MIMDLANNQVVFVDYFEKSFWSGTPGQYSRLAKQSMEAIGKVIEEKLSAVLDEGEDEKVSEEEKDKASPDIKIVSTGETETIAGYKTVKHEIRVTSKRIQEQWIASKIRFNGDFDVKQYGRMMNEFYSAFDDEQTSFLYSPEVIDLLKKGWPLRILEYEEDGETRLKQVIDVKKTDLDEKTFRPPDTFTEKTLEDVFSN